MALSSSLLRLSRLMVPALFLGYAGYANLAALNGRDGARPARVVGIDHGGAGGEH